MQKKKNLTFDVHIVCHQDWDFGIYLNFVGFIWKIGLNYGISGYGISACDLPLVIALKIASW